MEINQIVKNNSFKNWLVEFLPIFMPFRALPYEPVKFLILILNCFLFKKLKKLVLYTQRGTNLSLLLSWF